MSVLEHTGLEYAAASPGQRLLWLMDHYRGGAGMMNVPVIYRLRGELDEDALSSALAQVLARHEALRTRFVWRGQALRQAVYPPTQIAARTIDLSAEPDPPAGAAAAARARVQQDIDVGSQPPFDVSLYRLGREDHVLLLNVHHLVTDAWSNMLVCRDLGAFYNAARGRGLPGLPPVVWQYRDFVAWQQERLQGERARAHSVFWQHQLDGAAAPLQGCRQGAGKPAGRRSAAAENVWFTIDEEELHQLGDLARRERTSTFVVLLSLFFGVLMSVEGQQDVTVGSIFANRARPEVCETVGFFANMVPLRVRLAAAVRPTLRELVSEVRQTVLAALAHQELPYMSTPLASGRGARADSVVFHMLASPRRAGPPGSVAFDGLDVEALRMPEGATTRFELELLIVPTTSGADGVYRYGADRFERSFIETLATRYRALAAAALTDLSTPLADANTR
jgi:hypothetical protein